MLARERDPAVDLAEIIVVLRPRRLRPVAGAAQRERYAMPRDGDPVFEFAPVLRVNGGAEFDRARNPLGRRHRGELERVRALVKIGAEQYASATAVEAAIGIGDLPDRQVGVADAAIDRLVLLPEAALELQADLDGRAVGHGIDGRFHAIAD